MVAYDYSNRSKKKDPLQPHMDAYTSATQNQGIDYTDMMNRFRNIYSDAANAGGSGGMNFTHDVVLPSYESTADYRGAVGNLGELARTGGYSPSDIANIRARAVSPIRSVYANAARNLSRQRALQGGYSPNYAAATTRMARDQSSLTSDAMTNVNAQIAQDVARNRISTSVPFGSLTAGEQQSRNDFAQRNAEMANRYGFENLNNKIQQFELPFKTRLSALQGMTNLYGTTPANTALMQKGALSFTELQNQINQQNKNYDINQLGYYR